MRRFVLITAMLLVSATAQAGQSRNLSPVAANDEAPVVTTSTAQPPRAAEVMPQAPNPPAAQYQAPPSPPAAQYQPPTPPSLPEPVVTSPSYEERPAPVSPKTTEAPPPAPQPVVADKPTKADPSRKSAKADRGRRGRGYWTEARIIGELHRYGVYW